MSAQQWREEAAAIAATLAQPGVADVDTLKSMSGLEFLQAIRDGKLGPPPIGPTMGFHPISVEQGRVVFQGEPSPGVYNPIGSVHGGWAATLLDSCMACSVQTTVDKGYGYTTVEIKINYVRPITLKTTPLRAEGRVIAAGKRIATAEGKLIDADGRLYAHGTTTCLIFPL